MQYSPEMFKQDKLAVACAQNEISRLVAGEGTGNCSLYLEEYTRIAKYFVEQPETTKTLARMFYYIATAKEITGFDALVYDARLKEVLKKLKSMVHFRKRNKIKCWFPKEHVQPCYCARLDAANAAAAIAAAPIDAASKEEASAKVTGALILDNHIAVEPEYV